MQEEKELILSDNDKVVIEAALGEYIDVIELNLETAPDEQLDELEQDLTEANELHARVLAAWFDEEETKAE
jgi:hypothetical protein